MIQISELSFTYKGADRPALSDISLTIPDGGFVGIIGESGAGKTTLTYAINGIIPHHFRGDYYGSVTVEGLDAFEQDPAALSLHVGSVLQDTESQMVASVVEDEILFGLENFGFPREEIRERLEDALRKVGIESLRRRNISSLSGGQRQKVAIAAIVAMRPRILLLDEPTGELDPASSRQIFSLLRELNERLGMTIVVVEQKIMLLCEFARELAVMADGRLVCHGPVREVLARSRQLEELGVNCPRVVTLSRRLQEEGLGSGGTCINVDEAEQMVRRVLHDPV